MGINPDNIADRLYLDLILTATSAGRIVQVGSAEKPIPILIQEF